ncbi:MAG: conjugal transfer protein [Solirubrobacterales bacterium]
MGQKNEQPPTAAHTQRREPLFLGSRSSSSSVGLALRGAGRVALWVLVAVLLFRGLATIVAPADPVQHVSGAGDGVIDNASAAFAVRFARAYLADPSARALAPFLVAGAQVGSGIPPRGGGAEVAQAEVSATQELGDGRAVLTVACELRDARTLFLAVPIVRKEAGEVAALGAPSIVAAPGLAGGANERPQPLAGPDAGAIQALARKFMPEFLAARAPADLSYLLAPGSIVQPLAGAFELRALSSVSQLGSGEGPRRAVLARIRVSDPVSGALYPLAYRLEVVKGSRWYVEAVQGALA